MAPFVIAPAPWACKFDTYWMLFYHKGPLPDNAYDPLEQSSPAFSDPALAGEFKGGLGMIQICRYLETPVGPYDELLVIPGSFEIPRHDGQPQGRKNLRITRIYVDQKDTNYNGAGQGNWIHVLPSEPCRDRETKLEYSKAYGPVYLLQAFQSTPYQISSFPS